MKILIPGGYGKFGGRLAQLMWGDPVLSHAVLVKMPARMKVTTMTGGIAPLPCAGVWMYVPRGVPGYAGPSGAACRAAGALVIVDASVR